MKTFMMISFNHDVNHVSYVGVGSRPNITPTLCQRLLYYVDIDNAGVISR